jgi:hypothetical protein
MASEKDKYAGWTPAEIKAQKKGEEIILKHKAWEAKGGPDLPSISEREWLSGKSGRDIQKRYEKDIASKKKGESKGSKKTTSAKKESPAAPAPVATPANAPEKAVAKKKEKAAAKPKVEAAVAPVEPAAPVVAPTPQETTPTPISEDRPSPTGGAVQSETANSSKKIKKKTNFVLNTDASGKSPVIYGSADDAKRVAESKRQFRSMKGNTAGAAPDKPAGSATFYDISDEDLGISKAAKPADSTPAPQLGVPSERKPGFMTRMSGFFAGRGTGQAPAQAAAPAQSPQAAPQAAPQAPTQAMGQADNGGGRTSQFSAGGSGTTINAPVTFAEQGRFANMKTMGSGSINVSSDTVSYNQGVGSTMGDVRGGSVNPSGLAASTKGKATAGKGGTALSTGGAAQQGVSHPRAKNASSSGRSTTKNPRTQKP